MQHDTTPYNKVVKRYKHFLHNKCCTLLYEKLGSFDRGLSLTLSVKNLKIQKWHVYYHGCQGRKFQRKDFTFTRRKNYVEELLLMID